MYKMFPLREEDLEPENKDMVKTSAIIERIAEATGLPAGTITLDETSLHEPTWKSGDRSGNWYIDGGIEVAEEDE